MRFNISNKLSSFTTDNTQSNTILLSLFYCRNAKWLFPVNIHLMDHTSDEFALYFVSSSKILALYLCACIRAAICSICSLARCSQIQKFALSQIPYQLSSTICFIPIYIVPSSPFPPHSSQCHEIGHIQ